MKIGISVKIRTNLGKKYLDWAETLPKFGRGTIASLQEIRERQRKHSEDAFQRSRPSSEMEVEYLYFRLFEVFHIEDTDRLLKGLVALFPDLNEDFSGRNFSADFTAKADRVTMNASWNLGYIIRDRRNPLMASRTYRIVPDLPSEFEDITVSLHKILPSLFIVVFDVRLTDRATKTLLRLQASHYLPEIRFRRLIPSGLMLGGYSESNCEAVMTREILTWLKELRGKAEKVVTFFISGHFSRSSPDKTANLPAIEVYTLKGVEGSNEAFNVWIDEERGYWGSLGFDFYDYDVYKDDKQCYFFRRDGKVHRLLVFSDSYLDSVNLNQFGNDAKLAMMQHTQYMLTDMLPGVAIFELFNLIQVEIEELRRKVFTSMQTGWTPKLRLGKYINLNDMILQASVLLDRILVEFKDRKTWFHNDMKKIAELKNFRRHREDDIHNLRNRILESVNFKAEVLNEHISFVNKWYSQYLSLRNAQATYILAIIVGIATVVAGIATVIGVLF